MRSPQDSKGRMIGVCDRVSWRGQIYTIKSFGDPIGRCGTRSIVFEESLQSSTRFLTKSGSISSKLLHGRAVHGAATTARAGATTRARCVRDKSRGPVMTARRRSYGVRRRSLRRADGTVRFVMCNACFNNRFCTTCLVYFPSAQGRQVRQCPN